MARRGGIVGAALSTLADYAGVSLVPTARVELTQAALQEALGDVGTMRREASRAQYQDVNYFGRQRHDLTPKARHDIVARARVAWAEDPQAGAAVDLRNAFVFGRGVPKPRAYDDEVQDVIDRTWADPQNRRILTSHSKLMEKGVDMALQSNVFFLYFDDGLDGRVRMSLAEHDTIVNAVRDEEERQRILYYKALVHDVVWDWRKGEYVARRAPDGSTRARVVYYEALDAYARDLDDAVEVGDLESANAIPDGVELMPGKLLHLAVNKETEALFGIPRFRRLLRWMHAYEQIMRTSVDLMKAAASVYMKADVKGGRRQVERASMQQVRRASPLTQLAIEEFGGSELMPTPPIAGPSVLYENAGINYQPFKIDAHATDSATLATQARIQMAAGTGLPIHYTGDTTQGNLALASTVELPVLKMIEEEQEVWTLPFTVLADLAIARAIDTGWLTEWRDPTDEEIERMAPNEKQDPITGEVTQEPGEEIDAFDPIRGQMKRDLTFEFSLPNPLKRLMGDVVSAASTIAATFDPTGQNIELSRYLLGLVLEQAFDVSDPQRIVDQVYPHGFEPPDKQPQVVHIGPDGKPLPPGTVPFGGAGDAPGAPGADGKRHPAKNPYGAYQAATRPEKVQEWLEEGVPVDEVRALFEIMEAQTDPGPGARRGLRPRPDDAGFAREAEEFRQQTENGLRELVAAIKDANAGAGA